MLSVSLLVQAQERDAGAPAKAAPSEKQQPNEDGRRAGEAVIRGRVLYADSGRPLRRAEVTLYDVEAGAWRNTTSTDRRGIFSFAQLPAGRYLVIAEAAGILSPSAFLGRSDSLMTKIMLGEIKDGFSEVTVDAKGRAETEVRVRRGGVITGRVTADDGEPLSGADVKLLRRERGRFVRVESTWNLISTERRSLQTDSRGVYRIAGLPAGEYLVRVSEAEIETDGMGDDPEAYGNGSLVIAYYPSATSIGEAQAVTVLEGNEAAGIDVRMPARETHKISGTVIVGAEEEPAGYVEIKVDRADERPPRPSLLDVTTRTDDAGEWEVQGLPDGEYVVTVGAGLGARVRTDESSDWVRVAPRRFTVKVAGTDVSGLETRLAEGASLSGKVVVEGGKSLSYEPLILEAVPASDDKRPQPEETEGVSWTFVRDKSLTFKMEGLPPGRYNFRVRGVRDNSYYVKSLTRGGVDLMRSSFKIEDGQNLSDIQMTLATDVASVEGRVAVAATAAGKPSSSKTLVLLMPVDDAGRRFRERLLVARADEAGRFTLKAPPGDYFITAFTRQRAEKEPVKIDADSLMREQSKPRRITVRPGERVRVEELAVTSLN